VSAVLITGAAGDIGGAIVEELALAGRSLVLADQPSRAEALAPRAEACRAAGVDVETVTFDVTDEGAVVDAISTLRPLGGVVNNAGYQRRRRADRAVPTRRRAPCGRDQHARRDDGSRRRMRERWWPTATEARSSTSHRWPASLGLTKAAAKDLAAAGIRVNAVSPGFIGPGTMWQTQVAEQAAVGSQYYADDPVSVAQQMVESVPLRRHGSAQEVARVVAFLLSDAASYVNGANIEVSSGGI
jgi:NAD(P)-dependent dehydrogenase (short-subunit alcohol dehydrogenase family)